MAEENLIAEYYKSIHSPNYKFNDTYGLTYLTVDSYNSLCSALSYLRKVGEIDGQTTYIIRNMYLHFYKNESKIRYLDSLQPRFIAQKFIGKRKIREFIFKRDNYKCLRCGKQFDLTVDHIKPIHLGGDNKLSNLQTLCKSCNSYKSTTFKDYRNGAR